MTTPTGYTLVWSDEFNTDSLVYSQTPDNSKKWWTKASPNNVFINNGNLVLKATYENGYKMGVAICTYGFKYGIMDIKAKPASANGLTGCSNQICWLMPTAGGHAFETDTAGVRTDKPNIVYATAMYRDGSNNQKWAGWCGSSTGCKDIGLGNLTQNFHEYRFEWTPEYMKMSVDGIVYYTETRPLWNPKVSMSPRIGICVKPPGSTGICDYPDLGFITQEAVPTEMRIEYIKIYQKTEQPKKYKCINGNCVEDPTGTYNTQAECESNIKWACVNNQCMKVCPDYAGNKYNTLEDCQTASIQEINALIKTIEGLQKDADTKKTELQIIETNIGQKNIELQNKISGLLTTIVQSP